VHPKIIESQFGAGCPSLTGTRSHNRLVVVRCAYFTVHIAHKRSRRHPKMPARSPALASSSLPFSRSVLLVHAPPQGGVGAAARSAETSSLACERVVTLGHLRPGSQLPGGRSSWGDGATT